MEAINTCSGQDKKVVLSVQLLGCVWAQNWTTDIAVLNGRTKIVSEASMGSRMHDFLNFPNSESLFDFHEGSSGDRKSVV